MLWSLPRRNAARAMGLAMLTVTSCAAPFPPGLGFPRYEQLEGEPTALLEADIVMVNSCLGLDAGAVVYIALWPSRFGAQTGSDGRVEVLDGDRVVAVEGDAATFGGGEYSAQERAFVRGLVDDLPGNCQADGYWLVTTVE